MPSFGGASEALDALRALRLAMVAVSVAVAVAAYAVAAGRVPPEAEKRLFTAVNGLPDGLRWILWPVMQLGSLGGGLAVAAAAGIWRRDWRVAALFATVVIVAWYAAKAVKRLAGRGRPADYFGELELREPAEGLGFVSGHTAVAFALATVAYPLLPPWAEAAALLIAATVGFARIYFGAHLPLDVIGGGAIGMVVGIVAALAATTVAVVLS